ncbi:hypothetical protein VTL71DRAFT_13482 [Oculimacula yallundae]|uniref:Uncharacterized protein n=1 Tax=Oculimacula yallundae TaxID=86028 RepID=A0ABR4CMM4_9HELO
MIDPNIPIATLVETLQVKEKDFYGIFRVYDLCDPNNLRHLLCAGCFPSSISSSQDLEGILEVTEAVARKPRL